MRYVQIVFSPTGGTKKAADLLGQPWGTPEQTLNLADPNTEGSSLHFTGEELVLVAVPSYGGRVPKLAAQRLSQVQGNGAPCVLLCVYGNREFEDTLVELEDIARSCGLRPAAGVAAIAEHSIARQYAAGRPDQQDCDILQHFGEEILKKLHSDPDKVPDLPGNRPYKEKKDGPGMAPPVGEECVRCGLCARKCPVQAIDPSDVTVTDAEKCISCMRCIAVCPKKARSLPAPALAAVGEKLKPVCSDRKENKLFL